MSEGNYLPAIKEDFAAIVFWAHREVNPVGGATLLLDQLVEHPAVFISCIKQQTGIPDHLLWPQTPDINRAARQMITPLRPTALLIDFLTPISAVDNHGDLRSS